MKLSAPGKLSFYISLLLLILGLLAKFAVIGAIVPHAGWLLLAAWVVLAAGCVLTGF